jgi:hypothetical protein
MQQVAVAAQGLWCKRNCISLAFTVTSTCWTPQTLCDAPPTHHKVGADDEE